MVLLNKSHTASSILHLLKGILSDFNGAKQRVYSIVPNNAENITKVKNHKHLSVSKDVLLFYIQFNWWLKIFA